MRRTVVWALGAVLGAIGAFASDLADIEARGTLRVIAQKGEAPEIFRFSGEGEPAFEREMIQSFARIHGVDVEPVQVGTSSG